MFDFAVKREHIAVSPVTITAKDAGGREASSSAKPVLSPDQGVPGNPERVRSALCLAT
jgi:hypothetical protein